MNSGGGRPLMGVQVLQQQQTTPKTVASTTPTQSHANGVVNNNINNNNTMSQSHSTISTGFHIRAPIVITTPPSPSITTTSIVPVTSGSETKTSTTAPQKQGQPPSSSVTTTSVVSPAFAFCSTPSANKAPVPTTTGSNSHETNKVGQRPQSQTQVAMSTTISPTPVTSSFVRTGQSQIQKGEGKSSGSGSPDFSITTSCGSVGVHLQSGSEDQISPSPTPTTAAINTTTTSAPPSESNKIGKKMEHEEKKKVELNGNAVNAKPSISTESVSMSESDGEANNRASSRPSTVGKLLEECGDEIGDDVRMVAKLLENSGLCGPVGRGTATPSSRPTTAGGEIPPARPTTAEKPKGQETLEGNKKGAIGDAGDLKGVISDTKVLGKLAEHVSTPDKKISSVATNNRDKSSPTSSRPPTGAKSRPISAAGSRKSVESSASVEKTRIVNKTPKMDSEKAEPILPRSGGRSSERAASARASNTTPTTTSTLAQKSPKTPNTSVVERPKSAALSSTPRSRPSSTLYQHTASSAQKGLGTNSPHLASATSARATPSPNTPKSSRPNTRPRTSTGKMGDSTAGATGDSKPATLKDQFALFSKFGDTASDGKHITLSNSDKWMKQAKVIDGKKVTTTDTSICFKKLFKTTKKVPLEDFKNFLEELAKSKKIEPQTLIDKLTNCGAPGLSTATKAAHVGVVERLTDTSKYTGSHKERFDASGKGKGIEGRRDVADSSGYVASFKEKLDLNKDSPIKGGSPSPTPAAAVKEASPAPSK